MKPQLVFLFTLPLICFSERVHKIEPPVAKSKSEILTEIQSNMVLVPGGTFHMGCTIEQGSDCSDDAKPVHLVSIKSFYISKYEVTQEAWHTVMGNNPSQFSGCDNCPVDHVSWDEVMDFLSKLNLTSGKNFRFPTEAEWEYAARGGNKGGGNKYSGSDSLSQVAWCTDNSGGKTHPVGQKQANELGLYDMSGNVWEWCSDWYSSSYYSNSPANNPSGPSSGEQKVLRGGAWSRNELCRVSYRNRLEPSLRYGNFGFRPVQD